MVLFYPALFCDRRLRRRNGRRGQGASKSQRPWKRRSFKLWVVLLWLALLKGLEILGHLQRLSRLQI